METTVNTPNSQFNEYNESGVAVPSDEDIKLSLISQCMKAMKFLNRGRGWYKEKRPGVSNASECYDELESMNIATLNVSLQTLTASVNKLKEMLLDPDKAERAAKETSLANQITNVNGRIKQLRQWNEDPELLKILETQKADLKAQWELLTGRQYYGL